jgi:hypothetical protein
MNRSVEVSILNPRTCETCGRVFEAEQFRSNAHAAVCSTPRIKYYECGEGYAHAVGTECNGQCVLHG